MKPSLFRLKLLLCMLALICAVATSLTAGQTTVQNTSALSPQEKRGKQIYLKGEDDTGGEIVAVLSGDELELPATSFACVNCHGLKGEGSREGGLQPPPINWDVLIRPHTSALTRRERPAYDEPTLARAISRSLDPSGQPLHPGMPRYRMTAAQMSDLIAYLKKLGKESDTDPGVTEDTIKIGAALPLSGPLASIGSDVKATLAASFAQVNSQGGIYSRRFELVVEDSRGEAAQTLEATRKLIEQDGVFALVGSFEPGDSTAINELIKRSEVPLIGPITLSPKLQLPPNPYVFYLLPTFNDQARALVDFVSTKTGGKPARLAVVYARNDFDRDALAGLQSQAKLYSMGIVAEQGYDAGRFDAAAIGGLLASKRPDYIFFFGGGDEAIAFGREIERLKLNASLLSSVVMLGRSAFSLPESIAGRTFLSYPAALPNQQNFAEFLTIMQQHGVPMRSPAFQSVAFAAAQVLFEAAKLGSRQLTRSMLLGSLERLQDFRTGVVPPLTFGPNRRVGSTGSYIVGLNLAQKQYLPIGDRLTPKERP